MLAYVRSSSSGRCGWPAWREGIPSSDSSRCRPETRLGPRRLRDQPALLRTIANRIFLPYVAPALGIGHKLDVGAKRLADAVTDTSLQSGVFYASAAKTITGPVIDQAEILPQFHDARIQDHAYEAIRRFVPRRRPMTGPIARSQTHGRDAPRIPHLFEVVGAVF